MTEDTDAAVDEIALERARDGLRRYARQVRAGASGRRGATPGRVVAALSAAATVPAVGATAGIASRVEAALGRIGARRTRQVADAMLTVRRRLATGRSDGRRGQLDEQTYTDVLGAELEHRLAAGGGQADALRAELAGLLRAVDVVGTLLGDGVEAIVAPGGQSRDVLADALVGVGGWHKDFAWVLDDLGGRLELMEQQLARTEPAAPAGARAARQPFASLKMMRAELARLAERIGVDRAIARHDATAVDPPAAPGECPYPGLAAFRPEQAGWFRGRERLTRTLVERLATGAAPLVVIGGPGAGKSSLLQAGLLPAIAGGALPDPGSQDWPWAVLRPGPHPLESLASAVAAAGDMDGAAAASGLRNEPQRVRATATSVLRATARGRAPGPRRLIVVVDQFEELFTLCADDAERQAFLAALAALWDRQGTATGPVALVVLGVRADAYGRCVDQPLLRPALEDGPVLVGPMTDDGLRLAVSKPATVAGWSLEPGLIEALRTDLTGGTGKPYRPGTLPLFAHALRQTWHHRSGRTLTLAGYRATGGVDAAVVRTAERLHDGLDADGRVALRALLTALVDDGVADDELAGPGGPVRRRLPRAEALRLAGGAAATDVLDQLVEAGFVTDTDGTVELSHDVLMQAWPRLRGWLVEEAAERHERRTLTAAAQQWARAGRDRALLLRGARLARVETWGTDPAHRRRLPDAERDLLDASLAVRDAATRKTRRRTRRLAWFAAVLAALLAVSTAVSVLALRSRSAALDARRDATSRGLAAQVLRTRATDPRGAQLLAVAAWQALPTEQTRGALLSVAAEPYAGLLAGGLAEISSLDVSPDGATLAVTGRGSVELWSAAGSDQVRPLPGEVGGSASVAFSPDGRTVAAAGQVDEPGQASVRWWDAATGAERGSLVAGPASALEFVADGRLAVAGTDRTIHLYDLSDGREVWRTKASGGQVRDLATSPDGRLLAGAGPGSQVRLWRTHDGRKAATLGGHSGRTGGVAFSPDGAWLVSVGVDGVARRWDVRSRALVDTLEFAGRRAGRPPRVAVSPDGSRLAVVGGATGVQLWDAATGVPASPLVDRAGPLRDVVYAPDGLTLYAAAADGTVSRWRPAVRLPGGVTDVTPAVDVSADGRLAAASAGDGPVLVWEAATGRVVRSVPGAAATDVALRPDGTAVAVTGQDGDVRVYGVADGRTLDRLRLKAASGDATPLLDFAPDGRTLAVATAVPGSPAGPADEDVGLLVWRPGTGEPAVQVTVPRTGAIAAVGFSSDSGRVLAGLVPRESGPGRIRVWDAATGAAVGATAIEPSTSFSVGPGDLVVAGGADGVVRVVAVPSTGSGPVTGRVTGQATAGSGDPVRYAVLAPDGRTVAATSGKGSGVRLLDLTGGGRPVVLDRSPRSAERFAFSPDGRQLLTTARDSSVEVWSLEPGEVADRLCADLAAGPASRWAAERAGAADAAGADDLPC